MPSTFAISALSGRKMRRRRDTGTKGKRRKGQGTENWVKVSMGLFFGCLLVLFLYVAIGMRHTTELREEVEATPVPATPPTMPQEPLPSLLPVSLPQTSTAVKQSPVTLPSTRIRGATPVDRITNGFYKLKIVPDVISSFKAEFELEVTYGSTRIEAAGNLSPAAAKAVPHVQIIGNLPANTLYTLLLVDPDAPRVTAPTNRNWLHWLVTDLTSDSPSTADSGREVMRYQGPTPPIHSGRHRYAFIVCKQQEYLRLPRMNANTQRPKFNVQDFLSQYKLIPVAGSIFFSQQQ